MVSIKSFKDARKVISTASKKAFKSSIRDVSAWILILSNIWVGFLLIWKGLPITNLLWVYIAQSVIIGIFWFIKFYLFANSEVSRKRVGIDYIFPYFLVHVLYAAAIFGIMKYASAFSESFTKVDYYYILSGIGIFAVNHLISFFINYNKDKRKMQKLDKIRLVSAPYIRVIPIHFLILFNFLVIAPLFYIIKTLAGVSNIILVIIFILLKTYVDILMHAKEHEN
mgnify:CR=1 FL=1